MYGEDFQLAECLGKRPCEPVSVHNKSHSAFRSDSESVASPVQDNMDRKNHTAARDYSGMEHSSVTETARKRKIIHTVLVVIPEVEVKEEEEDPSSLFLDPIPGIDGSKELRRGGEDNGRPRLRAASAPPFVAGIQQHTPPNSPGVSSPDLVSVSFHTPFAASSQQTAPPTLPRLFGIQQHTPPTSPDVGPSDSISPIAFSQQPTPPTTPHPFSALVPGFDSPPPLPELSWPDEVNDFESYQLATSNSQRLVDHYLQSALMSVFPIFGEEYAAGSGLGSRSFA